MKEILFCVDFLLCLAVSILGILITIELRKKDQSRYSSSLLFFLVFFSAFGLYGIWGQQFLAYVITPVEDPGLMEKISRFLSFLGIPFLVTAWFMLLKFSFDIRFRILKVYLVFAFFLVNTGCIVLSSVFLKVFSAGSVVIDSGRIFFAAFNFLYFFLAGGLLILARDCRKAYRQGSSIRAMGWLLTGSGLLSSIPFLFSGNYWVADLFITLFFFLGMVLPAVFLRMAPLIPLRSEPDPDPVSTLPEFESFCQRYEISPREAEIIRELCRGHSNQEIADRLFITLQTVKDHLYRIFIKTEVKNRVQLVNLVRNRCPG